MGKKIDEAKNILKQVGLPDKQQNDICAYTLLALGNVKPRDKWGAAADEWVRIHDILSFVRDKYGQKYAENTRETIRKNCLHQFRASAIIEDNGRSTNSPQYKYRFTAEFTQLLRAYGTDKWEVQLKEYLSGHGTLVEKYRNRKMVKMIPVKIDGRSFKFSPGKHNQLQKAIIEEFAPRFAPGSVCLYIGDTADKDLYKNEEQLEELGIKITEHDVMPDVVLYRKDKDWLYLVEAVTSVGPISPKRLWELRRLTEKVKQWIVYVTAFLDIDTYKDFVKDIAWETEVWLAEMPDHMIHLNGDRFIGPRHYTK